MHQFISYKDENKSYWVNFGASSFSYARHLQQLHIRSISEMFIYPVYLVIFGDSIFGYIFFLQIKYNAEKDPYPKMHILSQILEKLSIDNPK